jgi:selenocysteine lyase/cysteine desulfurase
MLTFTVLYAMAASLELFLSIGMETVAVRVSQIAGKTRAVLREAGGSLLCDRYPHYDSPIIAAQFDGHDASDIARQLEKRNVLVAARHGNLRVSPHFYNNEEDVERFAGIMKEIVSRP